MYKKFIKILKTSKILIPVFITSFILGGFLYITIPIVIEQSMIKGIVKHSKDDVQRLQINREYYTKAVVGDIKKYAPNIKFDYNHQGVDGKVPFPTTTIHDLSDMYSQRSDAKFEFYSKYPFKNRKGRVLTPFQKEALEEVEKSEEGYYYKRDTLDGKEVLRVAVADYMVLPGCVSCHNTHKLKDWDFDWKLGDIRGVLEIITPMDEELKEMDIARNKIVFTALEFMLILFIYYAYILLKREKELNEENEELNEELNDMSKNFDKYVIVSKTDLKGRITYASEYFVKMSGYKQSELVGQYHNIINHEDIPKEIFKDMWETIKDDKVWTGEVKNKKKDGTAYWVNAIVSPIFNHSGKKIGYSAIREDITAKKEIDKLNSKLEIKIKEEIEKNRQKDQQMIEQSRLAQMGEMISMIAHQWRQPLAAISSTSGAINLKAQLNKLDNDTAIELSSRISDYSQHLSTTIDDFREFFKSNKEKRKTTYTEIINSVLGIVEVAIENKNITIKKDFQSDITFHTYPNELKQVVLNLVKNAEDVLLEKNIVDATITISTNKNILSVSDNGGGIHDDIMDKIFDPYFSTKTKKDGTGLGLYMSKTIIEEHCGGELSVSNEEDGAVFKIKLKEVDYK